MGNTPFSFKTMTFTSILAFTFIIGFMAIIVIVVNRT